MYMSAFTSRSGAKLAGARSSGEVKGARFTIEKEFEPGKAWDVGTKSEEVSATMLSI